MEQKTLSMAVVPESFLQDLQSSLDEVKTLLKEKNKSEINSQWVESGEARKIFGVSQRTWQSYRDERIIPFAQFGRKIYVKRIDIEAFLQNHIINKTN